MSATTSACERGALRSKAWPRSRVTRCVRHTQLAGETGSFLLDLRLGRQNATRLSPFARSFAPANRFSDEPHVYGVWFRQGSERTRADHMRLVLDLESEDAEDSRLRLLQQWKAGNPGSSAEGVATTRGYPWLNRWNNSGIGRCWNWLVQSRDWRHRRGRGEAN